MAKETLVYNAPPNWPVKKSFTPPTGWHPEPNWGPAPDGWPFWVQKKKHTGRNVFLIILLLIILGFVGCTALISNGVKTATTAKNPDANAQSCAGKTYPDQQKDSDHCADSAGLVTVADVAVTATPLTRDAKQNVCTTVSYTNNSDKTVSFNMLDWKIQSPTGEVQSNLFAGSGDLGSGQLIKGGQKSGALCFNPIKGSGAFVLLYKPNFLVSERGVWLYPLT